MSFQPYYCVGVFCHHRKKRRRRFSAASIFRGSSVFEIIMGRQTGLVLKPDLFQDIVLKQFLAATSTQLLLFEHYVPASSFLVVFFFL